MGSSSIPWVRYPSYPLSTFSNTLMVLTINVLTQQQLLQPHKPQPEMSPKPSPLLTSPAPLKPVALTYFLGFINKMTFIQDRTSVGLGPPPYCQHKYKQRSNLELFVAFIWALRSSSLPIEVQTHWYSFVSIISSGLASYFVFLSCCFRWLPNKQYSANCEHWF